MAFVDTLTDIVTLQQSTAGASDGAGSTGTGTWTKLVTHPCRVIQLTSRQLAVYERTETHEHGMRVIADDWITDVQGFTSLYSLLNSTGKNTFRYLYRGRTLTILGFTQASQGQHNTLAGIVQIDTVEAPEGVGRLDAT